MLPIKMGISRFVVAAVALLALTSVAQASPIPLYNTGVNSGGVVLADGTIGDPHYSLVSVPGGTTDIRVRSSAGGYPIPPYNGDDTLSRWIGPNNDTILDGPTGNYDYRTTFNLTGLDSASAIVSGFWATDNEGANILLNSLPTGNTIPDATVGAFDHFHPFSITTGFVPGINTLDFIVHNDADQTALRVEMTGTAAAVPEAGTLALLLSGLVGLGALRHRQLS